MKTIRAWFASRIGRLVLHDGAIAVGVGVAYIETTSQPIDRGVLIAAGVIAAKAFLRLILPVPAAPGGPPAGKAAGSVHTVTIHADTTQAVAALKEVTAVAKEASKAVAAVKPKKAAR